MQRFEEGFAESEYGLDEPENISMPFELNANSLLSAFYQVVYKKAFKTALIGAG